MSDLRALADRPVHVWNEDGLEECSLGLLFAALGLGVLIARVPSPITTPVPFVWIFLPAVIVATLTKRALPRLKALTISRVGYVQPRPASRSRSRLAMMTTLGIAAVAVWRPYTAGSTDVVVTMCGLLAAAFVYGAIRWSMAHVLALAVIPAAFGVWAYRTQAGISAVSWLLLALGVGLLVAGVVRLTRFLALHPVHHTHRS
jgi:hypothetical protein